MIYYPYILGIIDTLKDWDEKLKQITMGSSNNVAFATILIGGVFVVSAWAISTFYKK